MKRILLPAAALLVAFSGALFAQESVSDLSTSAQRAFLSGDYGTAKEKFGMVLRLDPANKVAANYLRMIQSREELAGKSGALEQQLQALVMPKVELRDATFPEALEALRQQAAKVSGGKAAVSFVLQTSPEIAKKTVSLNLTNIPFTEVLKYVGQLTGTRFDIEKYAIVVRPATPAVASAPAAEAAQ